jgi:NADH-quinone oxidoreductase subunit H
MRVYERPTIEYGGLKKKIVDLAVWGGSTFGPLLKRFAFFVFAGAVAVAILFVWGVARFVNPRVPWIVRDVIIAAGALGFVSLVAILGIWGERKVSGRIQSRLGPMRTGGWHGWSQSLADGLKFVQKEDLIPKVADKPLFRLAPYIALVPPITAYLAIPFGVGWAFRDRDVTLLFVLAMLGIEVLGVILGGWASNSKWSLYGTMREACQLVSYEMPMGLSLLVPVMTVGSLSLLDLGRAQAGGWFHWLAFRNPFLFVGFFTYYIASLAACKRAPFDLPEGESELVAGFHTEYSGFRFVMFFFAEYTAMFAVSAIATIVFLGGWNSPFENVTSGPLWFVAKSALLVFIQMWIRWTLPRIRIDQVMHACVKYMLPLTMILFVGNSLWLLYAVPDHPLFFWVARGTPCVLGLLGIVIVGSYVLGALYGFVHRTRMVGYLARKHLPGA